MQKRGVDGASDVAWCTASSSHSTAPREDQRNAPHSESERSASRFLRRSATSLLTTPQQ